MVAKEVVGREGGWLGRLVVVGVVLWKVTCRVVGLYQAHGQQQYQTAARDWEGRKPQGLTCHCSSLHTSSTSIP